MEGKIYCMDYPTYRISIRQVERLVDACLQKDCNFISCQLTTFANSGSWSFILSEEPLYKDSHTRWEFINVSKDDLEEWMFINGFITMR